MQVSETDAPHVVFTQLGYNEPAHEILVLSYPREGGGEGGGTVIFSYIRRIGPFLGFKNLNFNSFGVFQ